MMIDEAGCEDGNGNVDVPITNPFIPRETKIPAILIAGMGEVTVVPEMIRCPLRRTGVDLLAVAVIDSGARVRRGTVRVPTTNHQAQAV